MAYLPFDYEEDEERRMPTGQPRQNMGGGIGTGISQSGVSNTSSPAGGDGSGGKFISFSRYFDANKEGANKMANGMASGLDKAGSDALAARKTAQDKFVGAVNKGTLATPATAPQVAPAQALRFAPPQTGRTMSTATMADPRSAGGYTAGDARAMSGQTYQGPDSMDKDAGYAALLAQSQKAQDQLALAAGGKVADDSIDGGMETLLKEKYSGNGSGYNDAQSTMDAALTNKAGGGKFNALKHKYGGIVKALEANNAASVNVADAGRLANDAAASQYGSLADQMDREEEIRNRPPIQAVGPGGVASFKPVYGDYLNSLPPNERYNTMSEDVYNSFTTDEWVNFQKLSPQSKQAVLEAKKVQAHNAYWKNFNENNPYSGTKKDSK